MNRDEKNLQTRRKIIDSAWQEFSEKSYGEASLNTVCATGNISKGIIYHYFKDKDELYLICVKECFDALTSRLASVATASGASTEAALESYFGARAAFFASHPPYLKLFCHAVMNPPAHLLAAIAEITADFDALNISILTGILETAKLLPDITVGEVVEVFREYQNFVNTRFPMRPSGGDTLEESERRRRLSLKILLYGVIKREDDSPWAE